MLLFQYGWHRAPRALLRALPSSCTVIPFTFCCPWHLSTSGHVVSSVGGLASCLITASRPSFYRLPNFILISTNLQYLTLIHHLSLLSAFGVYLLMPHWNLSSISNFSKRSILGSCYIPIQSSVTLIHTRSITRYHGLSSIHRP